jgi:FMN hydrolase / 5-amino-6-(5-phospho-D-ribitylamino)uracil phosphatase
LDLDNTLWDNTPVLLRAEQACYDYLQQHAPRLTTHYTLDDLAAIRIQMMAESPQLAAQVSKVRKLAMQKALENIAYDAEKIPLLVEQAFVRFHDERNKVKLFPQTLPLLENLQKQYSLAAITNGNSDLEKIGIANFFDFSLSAEKIGAKKPRPNIFHAAMHKANISPQEMVHIGDHHDDDIFGAQQLGIHTIWFNPQQLRWEDQSHRDKPTATVHSLSEVTEKIALIDAMYGH